MTVGRLLTDEEFSDAQMDYIKRHQEQTGITWHFPLGGELRDDCNRKAQFSKDEARHQQEIEEIFREIEAHSGIPVEQRHPDSRRYFTFEARDFVSFKSRYIKEEK